MKKGMKFIVGMVLTATLLGGLSQSKIISYACEKDEYLIVNDNKDVNVRNISRLQADDIENDKDVICVERMINVTGSAQLSFESGLDKYEDEWNVKND